MKFKFWTSWDDKQKSNAIIGTGVAIGIFALLTLISSISYLFTWKTDKSLLSDPSMLDKYVDVANIGGKMGLKLADTLVGSWFGWGSFALVILLFAISIRLIAGKWRWPLLKTALMTVSGAFVASLLFALIGKFVGLDTLYGSGIGGGCGEFIAGGLFNLFGPVITTVFVLAVAGAWMFFCSDRFADWFRSLGKNPEFEEEPVAPTEEEVEVKPKKKLKVAFVKAKPEPEPEIVDEPEKEVEIEPEIETVPSSTGGRTVHDMYYHGGSSSMEMPDPEAMLSRFADQKEQEAVEESEIPETEIEQPETVVPEGNFEIDRGNEITTEVVQDLPKIDVRLDPPEGLPKYEFPGLDLLKDHTSNAQMVSDEELNRNNNKIRSTLKNYKIEIADVKAVVGPTVTLYKVYPAPGVKIATIKNLQDDIAMSLNARGVRIVKLPDSVGIEVANDIPATVPVKGLLNDDAFRSSKAELPVAIGCNIQKKVKVFDLADAPHLLVAGATKQGKSVGLNVLIASLLYSKHPAELKLVFVDPKMVEFSPYGRLLKHYLAVLPSAANEEEEQEQAIIKDPKSAEKALRSICIEMDERYALLSKAYVNNVKLYNEKFKNHKLNPSNGHKYMPYLVVIIDEYADLAMSGGNGSEGKAMQKSIMGSIVRLAQKGRAAGIHVVIATQRPSVDVITGLIKANFPARIAFRVSTRVDSNTILDATGAEKLIGRGDMLYSAGVDTERIQCGYIDSDEINALTEWIGDQQGYKKCYNTPYYLPDPDPADGEGGSGSMIDMKDLDERFEEAARMVVMTQRGSTSDIQRRLGMGYAKAGRVMDQLEAAGIVGPQEGSKPRQVLISNYDDLELILKAFMK